MTAHKLDTRGLVCPLPVLKARKVLLSMPAGAQLEVVVSDARAPRDFADYCLENGHKLLSQSEKDGVYTLLIER